MPDPDPQALAALPLFRGLPPQHRAALAELLHARSARAGALLISAEQPGEVAYLIQAGTVKVCAARADGSEVIIALRGPGELVGEMSLIDEEVRSADVVALEACRLWWIDRAAMEGCLRTMPELAFNLLRLLSRRLRAATAQIQALATLDVPGRVARQLLTFAEEYGQAEADGAVRIPLRLTQGDLASMVGATRASVNEVVVTFKQLGYLAVDARQHHVVLDRQALARRSQ
jgi:CRP/FNR family cyclic AMP-dependent transcriptional regulator